MSVTEKLLRAGALVMALCCALLPVAGAALGGELMVGAGNVGVIAGAVVLVAVIAGSRTGAAERDVAENTAQTIIRSGTPHYVLGIG